MADDKGRIRTPMSPATWAADEQLPGPEGTPGNPQQGEQQPQPAPQPQPQPQQPPPPPAEPAKKK